MDLNMLEQRRRQVTVVLMGVCLAWVGMLISSCGRPGNTVTRVKDSWERSPGNDALLEWERVSKDDLVEVPAVGLEMAIELLRDRPLVELAWDDFNRLGMTREDRKDAKPYLIRGVKFAGARGGFDAYTYGKAVWIRQGILTVDPPPPVRKAPVVVWLPFTPSTVCVGVISAR